MRQGDFEMPERPVVVGDRLFTNTSKRWISTANVREDVSKLRRFRLIEAEKRSAQQEYDNLMKSFRDLWNRKLDKSRLTKLPEEKKKEDTKKEMAAYLRDVYSDTSSIAGFDLGTTFDFMQSMSKKTNKKKGKKSKKLAEIKISSEINEEEVEGVKPEEMLSKGGFSVGSLASLGRYIPNSLQDVPENTHGRIDSLRRPIKSAGDVKPQIDRPPLNRMCSSYTMIPDPDFGVSSPFRENLGEGRDSFAVYSPTIEQTAQLNQGNDTDRTPLGPGKDPDEGEPDVQSSQESFSTFESGNLKLDRLCLVPKALPPIYQTKAKKPVSKAWDYPLAGSVRTPPDRLDREGHKSELTLSDQLEDLQNCRYLRLGPNKASRRRKKKPKNKKDSFFLVVAGRAGPPGPGPDMLAVHAN